MSIETDETTLKKILLLFLKIFPDNATRGTLEIYYGDGYSEYPMMFEDSDCNDVKRKFSGWDSPDMIAEDELVEFLSATFLKTRDGVVKTSEQYWNHFLFVVENGIVKSAVFTYRPELDEKREEEVRKSIGDELFNKYKNEKKHH